MTGRPFGTAGSGGKQTSGDSFDAIVLAGGEGRRLGGVSKPEVVVAGRTLLDRVLDAAAGARRVVVVGPPHLARDGLRVVLEHPPLGGPVAGIDAGLMALEMEEPTDAGDVPVLVVACDVPLVAAAVPALLGALRAEPRADGALLVHGGSAQLVAVHRARALRTALNSLLAEGGVHGVPVRRLLERLRMVDVPDPEHLGMDADTWDDVARLESALVRRDAMTAETPTDLDRWAQIVARDLGIDADVIDRDLILDLSRDVAHTVARPAVPLTAFLLGYAVGVAGGGRPELETVVTRVAEINARWGEEHGTA